jgi:hypothetical protein
MKKQLILLCVLPLWVIAQVKLPEKKLRNPNPVKTWFGMSGVELIFSGGKVNDAGNTLSNAMRFTAFFNVQQQSHYDFNSRFGIFTGYGIRNVGFIHEIAVPNVGSVTLKQRSYGLGLPLAIKFGNMERGNYIAIGIEEEWMFHYKRKLMFNDDKLKFSEWFSPEVKMFNTSAFIDIRGHGGTYLRFKYYLSDFLQNKTINMIVPGTQTQIGYTPLKSSLFYISIGMAIKAKKKHRAKPDEV